MVMNNRFTKKNLDLLICFCNKTSEFISSLYRPQLQSDLIYIKIPTCGGPRSIQEYSQHQKIPQIWLSIIVNMITQSDSVMFWALSCVWLERQKIMGID